MGEGASCGQTGRVRCRGRGGGLGGDPVLQGEEPGLICKAREVVEGF